jgi:predicted alpha/beta-hydrolase family hydrolase
VPCLFVHGTRDPFGAPDELERWTATIPAPVTHHWVDGGRHDLKGADAEVAGAVVDWLATAVSGRRRRRPGG